MNCNEYPAEDLAAATIALNELMAGFDGLPGTDTYEVVTKPMQPPHIVMGMESMDDYPMFKAMESINDCGISKPIATDFGGYFVFIYLTKDDVPANRRNSI